MPRCSHAEGSHVRRPSGEPLRHESEHGPEAYGSGAPRRPGAPPIPPVGLEAEDLVMTAVPPAGTLASTRHGTFHQSSPRRSEGSPRRRTVTKFRDEILLSRNRSSGPQMSPGLAAMLNCGWGGGITVAVGAAVQTLPGGWTARGTPAEPLHCDLERDISPTSPMSASSAMAAMSRRQHQAREAGSGSCRASQKSVGRGRPRSSMGRFSTTRSPSCTAKDNSSANGQAIGSACGSASSSKARRQSVPKASSVAQLSAAPEGGRRSRAESGRAEARDGLTQFGGVSPIVWSAMWCGSAPAPPAERVETQPQITLLKSVFEGRPPVLLFGYYPPAGIPERDMRRTFSASDLDCCCGGTVPKMYFSHKTDTHEYNAVLNTFRHAGLRRTGVNSGKWAVCWGSHPKTEQLRSFHAFQKTNHFPGSWQLGRKDMMWRNIRKMQRQWPDHFDITPPSYVLPDDYHAWRTAREAGPQDLWIFKPANSSCGRGIKLLRSTLDSRAEKMYSKRSGIIQRYLDRPLLLDGYKFDLRIYIVVTSYDPLKIYMNSEGLVRLATEKYSTSPKKLNHRTMHLTNYSVNKKADCYVKNMDGRAKASGVTSPGLGDDEPDAPQAGDDELEDCADDDSPLREATNEAGMQNATLPRTFTPCSDAEASESDGQEEGDSAGFEAGPQSSKWSLLQLQEYFARHGLDYQGMMRRIKDLIVKAVLAVEPIIVSTWHQGANFQGLRGVGPNQTCFEIYGFDVMVDVDFKPWLLEVNVLPSLSSSSPLDKRIKTKLIADALTLVGFSPFDQGLMDNLKLDERSSRLLGLQSKGSVKSHTVRAMSSNPLLKDLGEAEWNTILDTHDEFMRRGSLERIFPNKQGVERYAPFFSSPRYSNLVLSTWLQAGGDSCFRNSGRGNLKDDGLPTFVPKQVFFDPC